MNNPLHEPGFFRWIRAARRQHAKRTAGLTPEQRAEQARREAGEVAKAFQWIAPQEAGERLDVLLADPIPIPAKRSAGKTLPRKRKSARNIENTVKK